MTLPGDDVEGLRVDWKRSWADEAHVAAEDIEQLGQLVEGEAAHEYADRRHPRVVAKLEEQPAADVGMGMFAVLHIGS